jgi:hypothetical protein
VKASLLVVYLLDYEAAFACFGIIRSDLRRVSSHFGCPLFICLGENSLLEGHPTACPGGQCNVFCHRQLETNCIFSRPSDLPRGSLDHLQYSGVEPREPCRHPVIALSFSLAQRFQ